MRRHSRYSRTVAAVEERTVDNIVFHSKAEARRYIELKLLVRAGDITDLERQVRIPLQCGETALCYVESGRQVIYQADFVYKRDGQRIIEDVKGHRTEMYRLKRAILATMGIEINEVITR